MIVYTAHEPGQPAASIEKRAQSIVFVKEGFSWLGFLLPPVFLLVNALWFELIAFGALGALLTFGIKETGLIEQAPTLASLVLGFLIGFEGNNLRRWRLERKKYLLLGSVMGQSRLDCEQRFFAVWLPFAANEAGGPDGKPHSTPQKSMPAGMPSWQGPTIVGTFSEAT